jgi:hypothetical protein
MHGVFAIYRVRAARSTLAEGGEARGGRMRVPDSAVTAAAGLIGAIIGGASTYLASRVQWRRESRRTAYAALISVAYEVESLITAQLKGKETIRMDADPRIDFYSRLDSASLLAKPTTQHALRMWRSLSRYLDRLEELSERERKALLAEWQLQRNRFYEFAKDELGVKGWRSNRRAAVFYYVLAFVSTLAWLTALEVYRDYRHPIVRGAAVILLATSMITLSLALWAVQRWKKTRDRVRDQRRTTQDYLASEAWRFVKNTPPAQFAISIALICDILCIWLLFSSAGPVLGTIAFLSLFAGAFLQAMAIAEDTPFLSERVELYISDIDTDD